MRLVGRTSSRVATGSVSRLGGCAMGTTIAATTLMKPSARRLLASLKHTSLARTDIASQPGGGAMEITIAPITAMNW